MYSSVESEADALPLPLIETALDLTIPASVSTGAAIDSGSSALSIRLPHEFKK